MNLQTLDDDDRVIAETAGAFAAKRLAPRALEWDHDKHFPVEVLRESAELGMAASTLSHHLDKLKSAGLVTVQREGTYLRCTAHTAGLEALLGFLYAECCTRSKAVEPGRVTCCGGPEL